MRTFQSTPEFKGDHFSIKMFVPEFIQATSAVNIGDGASHPLSDFFATLGAAQEVYPHANNLTNQLAWAAGQAGMNSPNVRCLYAPTGRYLLDQPFNLTNRLRGGFRVFGDGRQVSSTGQRATVFLANTGGVCFDLSGSEYITLEDFAIDGTGMATPSTIGVLYGRTEETAFAESQLNSTRHLLVRLPSAPSANDGNGSLAMFNYASELARHYGIFLEADVPYWATNHNPTSVVKEGESAGTFTISSPYATMKEEYYSCGNTSFEGQCCFIAIDGHACVVVDGVSFMRIPNGYFKSNGTCVYAINQSGPIFNSSFSGNAETLPRIFYSRHHARGYLEVDFTASAYDGSNPQVFLDEGPDETDVPIIEGGRLRVHPVSTPTPHVLLRGGAVGQVLCTVDLHNTQSIEIDSGVVNLRVISDNTQPDLSLPIGSTVALHARARVEFQGRVVSEAPFYGDLTAHQLLVMDTHSLVVDATNASPIVVRTRKVHRLTSGDHVTIEGVSGNSAANVTNQVATVLSTTTFSIPVAGNGDYFSGGIVRKLDGTQCGMIFNDNGSGKWSFTKNSDHAIAIADIVNARNILRALGSSMVLGATGVTVFSAENFQSLADLIATGKIFPSATSQSITAGSADPEGSVTANQGSLHLRSGGGALVVYFKSSGSGTTGWVAVRSIPAPGASGTYLGSNGSDYEFRKVDLGNAAHVQMTGGTAVRPVVFQNGKLETPNALTASRPMKSDGSGLPTTGRIAGTDANEFNIDSIANGNVLASDGSGKISSYTLAGLASNLQADLKTYFDTLYAPIVHDHNVSITTSSAGTPAHTHDVNGTTS